MQVPFVDLKAQYRTIQGEVLRALADTLEGMDLTAGPNVRAFEAEFAAYCRTRYAIGVGSETDALYLALRACGIRAGDEVITVANGGFAAAEAILLLGAVPVFVDVDPHTYTLDVARLEAAIGPRTRAVVPVHIYGQMADMQPIMLIARRHGLVVVEDAGEAHGAGDRERRAGSVGHAAAFSLDPWGNLGAYGEAGAVTTSSRAVAEEVRLLRDRGAANGSEHREVGLNSHLDEIQAAVLRVKLRYLDTWNVRRRAHARSYQRLLAGLDVVLPFTRPGAHHVFNLFVVRTAERDRVREALANRGVETRVPVGVPLHQQSALAGAARVAGDLRVTEAHAGELLALPIYPELQPQQLAYVAECLQSCFWSTSRKAKLAE